MLDRTLPPPFSLSTSLNLLKPQQVNLQTGAKLFFVQGGEQEVVKLELIFPAGRWFEELPGISHFTALLLSKGTKTKTSGQIAGTLESLGVHLEINPGYDFVSVSLFGLSKHLAQALDILIEVCSSPSFSEAELNQFKSIFLQTLRINQKKTNYLASTAFRENLFGKNHPYGSQVNENHVQSMSHGLLRSFHNTHYKYFTGFITGSIPKPLKANIVEKLNLIPLQAHTQRMVQSPLSSNQTIQIKKTDSVQVSLRLGKFVVSRKHPDYPGLVLANHALGGYFGSRLMQRLREEKGLTYGIHSAIHPLLHHTYFVISADVNKEHHDFAIEEIISTIRKFRSQALQDNELQLLKNHFLGSLFVEISTPFTHTEKLKNIYLNQLENDYYQNLITQIQKISAEELSEIAERYLQESEILIVSAG